jgi:mono/diheme cytochrome c family protein
MLVKRFSWMALILVIVLSLVACSPAATPAPTATEDVEIPQPSNPGGPGAAMSLTGDATKGAEVYKTTCVSCHGDQGKGGVPNPGSTDGTVPPLNPIDPGFVNADAKVFATNIDLFVEHGSAPEGDNPTQKMLAFGDTKVLTPQQIADVIAYVISLNKK